MTTIAIWSPPPRRGDRAALDTPARPPLDRIHAVCARIAGPTRDADDATQKAMIGIVRGLDRFDGRSAFSHGRTGSPPTPRSTSCADGVAGRSCTPSPTTATRPSAPTRRAERQVDAVVDRMTIDEALADPARRLPRGGRAARRRRDGLRRDRRGAQDPARHRQVTRSPGAEPARRGAREPDTLAGRPTEGTTREPPRHLMNDEQDLLASALPRRRPRPTRNGRGAEADPEVMAAVERLRELRSRPLAAVDPRRPGTAATLAIAAALEGFDAERPRRPLPRPARSLAAPPSAHWLDRLPPPPRRPRRS